MSKEAVKQAIEGLAESPYIPLVRVQFGAVIENKEDGETKEIPSYKKVTVLAETIEDAIVLVNNEEVGEIGDGSVSVVSIIIEAAIQDHVHIDY